MWLARFVTALVIALPVNARAEVPEARPDYAWTATVEAGVAFQLFEQSELGRALDDFGYTLDAGGWSLLVALDHSVLDWLDVGGTLSTVQFTGAREASAEMSFTRVTARAHARASLCLVEHCRRDEAAEFGVQLAAGGGVTLWGLRDEVETAPHLSLEASLSWSLLLGHWGFGLRLGHALVIDGGLGPLALDTGVSWSPTLALQVYYRW